MAENPVKNQSINLKTNISNPTIELFDIRGAAVPFRIKTSGGLYELGLDNQVSAVYILRVGGTKKRFIIRLLAN